MPAVLDCPTCGRPWPGPAGVFDDARHVVIAGANETYLPLKPWQILAVLRRRPGQLFSRAMLEAALYDNAADYPDTRTIDAHLVKVRRALRGTPYRIGAVHSVGWRLDVSRHQRSSGEPTPEPIRPPAPHL